MELDRGPVPYQSVLGENLYVLPRALIPLAIQAACYYLFPGEYHELVRRRAWKLILRSATVSDEMAVLRCLPRLLPRVQLLCSLDGESTEW